MRMGFMADKLTGPARRYLEIFIDTLSFFFAAVVMVYGGISITRLTMIQITASLRISMGWKMCIRDRTYFLYRYYKMCTAHPQERT